MIAAYIRASKATTGELGPSAQRSLIEAWAAREGTQVDSWHFDNDVSGGAELDDRPALMAALDALDKGSTLVVAKRDRIARDVLTDAMVHRLAERKGATIVSADGQGNGDDPASEAMRGMLAVFAQFERAIIRARTRSALLEKAKRGERVGACKFGFEPDGLGYKPIPAEQVTLTIIYSLWDEGHTLRDIAADLESRGIPTKRGGQWRASTLQQILSRR